MCLGLWRWLQTAQLLNTCMWTSSGLLTLIEYAEGSSVIAVQAHLPFNGCVLWQQLFRSERRAVCLKAG